MARFSTKKLGKQIDKWTHGYYSTGYKNSKTKNTSQSSFWLDDDFLSKDYGSDTSEKTENVIKLAAYKRAIGNFVRIVTNRDDIKVTYSTGKDSYTDGTEVVISAKLNETEFDPTVGLALHEGSHIALTDFKVLKRLPEQISDLDLAKFHPEGKRSRFIFDEIRTLINIIEDRRIDNYIYTTAPGYRGYYTSLYDKYFNAKEIDTALRENLKMEVTWDNYIFHICNFVNSNRNLKALPGLEEVWNLINIANIGRLKNTQEVADLAIECWKVIQRYLKAFESPINTQSNESGDSEDTNDNGDSNGSGGQSDDDQMGGLNLDLGSLGDGTLDRSPGSDSSRIDQLPKNFRSKLEKAIEEQRNFLEGKLKKSKVSRTVKNQIDAISESNTTFEEVGTNASNRIPCLVVRGFNDKMLQSGLLSSHAYWDHQNNCIEIDEDSYSTRNDRNSVHAVDDGIQLGKMLGRKLQTRNENRSLKTTRLDTGRIDRRLIAELGFGNDKVFSNVLHYTVNPAIIHISVDASGSMHGGKKWYRAFKTAVAIAQASSMTANIDCVISIRGNADGYPLMWIVYDSRVDNLNVIKHKLKGVLCNGSTPEGLCYEAVLKEIVKSSESKDSYLINLCDGEPCFSSRRNGFDCSYGGHAALEHTATQIKKIRAAGVNVLSYFIYDSYRPESSVDNHRIMYGKSAIDCNVEDLNTLAKTLNSFFVRNND